MAGVRQRTRKEVEGELGMRKGIVSKLAVTSVVIIAGTAAVYSSGMIYGGQAEAARPQIEVARGDISRTVAAGGKLMPSREVDVGAQVSGQLRRLHVAEGDHVERGTLLAEIDPTLAQAKLVEAEAAVEVLQADLTARNAELVQAQASIERLRKLAAKNIVSGAELDIAVSEHAVAQASTLSLQAQIRQAEAALETARANIDYTRIVAPMTGTVISVAAREGQTLNANNAAPLILQIADLTRMRVEAEVSEADVALLRAGQQAHFSILGQSGTRWEGALEQILPQPIIDNQVVFYRALFEVDNDGRLMSQMTAQVYFVLDSAEDLPLVPLSALSDAGRNGADDSVHIAHGDGRVEQRMVRIGVRDEVHAAIVEGLTAGEMVLAGGAP
jgi:membrane fusion protein, macrolide-specific efflux system